MKWYELLKEIQINIVRPNWIALNQIEPNQTDSSNGIHWNRIISNLYRIVLYNVLSDMRMPIVQLLCSTVLVCPFSHLNLPTKSLSDIWCLLFQTPLSGYKWYFGAVDRQNCERILKKMISEVIKYCDSMIAGTHSNMIAVIENLASTAHILMT